MLTVIEQLDLQAILGAARNSGWLLNEADVRVVRRHSAVTVSCTCGAERIERRYDDTHRWPYELLSDLARGGVFPRVR